MEQINDSRIEQCLNDIQKYEKWGGLLAGQCSFEYVGNTLWFGMRPSQDEVKCNSRQPAY